MRRIAALVAIVLLGGSAAVAQPASPDVDQLVELINQGQAEAVRADLPSLLSRYPNNPGLLYVQGMLTQEGAEAVRLYQSVVDNFPKTEWADDALYRVYQFYYSLGLYKTAELKLNQLKKEYPGSKYLTGAQVSDPGRLKEEAPPAPVPPAPRPDVPAVQPEDQAAAPAAVPSSFALQVGAYTAQTNADRQKKFFEERGYSVEVIIRVRDGRSLFVVLVGAYRTYDDAKAAGAELKRGLNIDSFVISR